MRWILENEDRVAGLFVEMQAFRIILLRFITQEKIGNT